MVLEGAAFSGAARLFSRARLTSSVPTYKSKGTLCTPNTYFPKKAGKQKVKLSDYFS